MRTGYNIPSVIRIFGKEWKIEIKPELKDNAYGYCNERTLTIEIQSGLPETLFKDTLLHEILHAIDWTVGSKLTEEQVGVLASGLIGTLFDNPKLSEFLCLKDYQKKKK